MSVSLPLYPKPLSCPEEGGYASALELTQPRGVNHDCRLCPLATKFNPRTVCINPEGDPGGILVVGEGPGRTEDMNGIPFCGDSGKYLRDTIKKTYTGPVVFDNAVRCFPGKDVKVRAADIETCRGYLAKRLIDVKPTRIICVGASAAYAVLGRRIAPMSARKAYGWIARTDVPVFTVMHPAAAMRNRRFLAPMFEEDLAWALTAMPPNPPPKRYTYRLVRSENDARAAERELSDGLAYDCETSCRPFDANFIMFNLAACAYDATSAWVWDYHSLSDARCLDPLKRLLKSPRIGKAGHSLKYDMLTVRAALGIEVAGAENDTLMDHRILDPEADGDLGSMSELVGMGGHKIEAEYNMAKNLRALKSSRLTSLHQGHLFDSFDWLPEEVNATIRLGADPDDYKYALIEPDVMNRYNARDAVATALLRKHLRARIARIPELQRVSDEMVLPAVRAYERVEAWGLAVSREAVKNFAGWLDEHISDVDKRLAPYNFNPDSNDQVAWLLYEKLKLPCRKMTDHGANSVDKEALAWIKDEHEVVSDILENRRLKKLKNTYCTTMYQHIMADGRVHPNFHPDGARTGRGSVTDPPLQTLPRAADSIEGKMTRDMFVAIDGHVLLSADYCLAPSTRVLTADLRWVPVKDVSVGDKLIGFDEKLGLDNKWRITGVEKIAALTRPCYRIETDRGIVVCSEEHMWVVRRGERTCGGRAREWVEAKDIQPGDSIAYFCDPWETDQSRDGGYLAGFLDGEGWYTDGTCGFGQNRGAVLNRVVSLLKQRGLSFRERAGGSYECRSLYFNGGGRPGLRAVGMFRPTRLLDKAVKGLVGKRTWSAHSMPAHVLSITSVGEQPVVALRTSTHTMLAEGFLSHNCQLEFKIAAGLSGDPEMLKIANDPTKDFHQGTGQLVAPVMGWKLDANGEVDKPERSQAKITNFAMLFDFGESQIAGLSRRLGCSMEEAQRVRDAVLGKFRKFDLWAKSQVRSVRQYGEVWTWWQGKARRRPMFRIASQDQDERATAERSSINTPIQGTSAEFCTQSAVKMVEWIVDDCVPAKLVLTVHDSLILEVREDCLSEVAAKMVDVMLGWPTPSNVQLGVDLEVGPAWGSLTPYEVPI